MQAGEHRARKLIARLIELARLLLVQRVQREGVEHQLPPQRDRQRLRRPHVLGRLAQIARVVAVGGLGGTLLERPHRPPRKHLDNEAVHELGALVRIEELARAHAAIARGAVDVARLAARAVRRVAARALGTLARLLDARAARVRERAGHLGVRRKGDGLVALVRVDAKFRLARKLLEEGNVAVHLDEGELLGQLARLAVLVGGGEESGRDCVW